MTNKVLFQVFYRLTMILCGQEIIYINRYKYIGIMYSAEECANT